jgi:hypothetical protein
VKRGEIFDQTEMPPSLVNWPKATSRKKTGIPPVTRQIKYGIRKAPEYLKQSYEFV